MRPVASRVLGLSLAAYIVATSAVCSGVEWCAGFGPYGFDGTVWHAVVFEGDLVVTGGFSANGSVSLSRAARWDGNEWLAMGDPTVPWAFLEVAAACVYGGELYIGGRRYENAAVLLKWNGTGWDLVDQAIGNYGDGQITSMIEYGGNLILAGDFTGTPGQPFGGSVVGWNGTSWVILNDPPDMGGFIFQPSDLAVYHGDLYLTGSFSEAGGVSAHSIARWNGTQWTPVEGFANGMTEEGLYRDGSSQDAIGCALAVFNDQLVIGGFFNRAGQRVTSNLVAWDGNAQTWESLGNVDDEITSLSVSGGSLIAGGYFQSAGGVPTSHVAVFDGSIWSALGSGTSAEVYETFIYGTDVVLGGPFRAAGGQARGHLAIWDGAAYSGLENPGLGVSANVYSMVEYGGDLIVGGSFTTAGSTPASRLASWDGAAWQEFAGGAASEVRSLYVDGTDLYAGGFFTSIGGGVSASRIARWDGTSWTALGSGAPSRVFAMVNHDGQLYAGGYNYLQTWDGVSWQTIPTNPSGAAVLALATFDNKLIVGGTHGGGDFLKTYDGGVWTAMAGGIPSEGVSGEVRCLTAWNGSLYVGGIFGSAAGEATPGLARWDGTTLYPLGSLGSTLYLSSVLAMTVVDDVLFVTGGGGPQTSWLAGGATEWEAVSAGWKPPSFGYAIAGLQGDVYAGGAFAEATNGELMYNFANLCGNATAVLEPTSSSHMNWSLSPNPFNPWVQIRYEVDDDAQRVTLRIVDVHGRVVRHLIAESRASGPHQASWDGRNDRGNDVASGVYFAQLQIGSNVDTKKAVLVR